MQNSSSMNLWAPSGDRVDRGQASLDLFCEVLEISIACHFRLTATRLFFRICALVGGGREATIKMNEKNGSSAEFVSGAETVFDHSRRKR